MLNKLNKNLYLMCAAMAMGIASSCTSDAPEIPAEELYTREWVKNFGVMDATQDWNNATRGSVQVDVKGGPKRVRVTTVIDDVTYLLADYPEVSGVQKLEFDIPRGLTDIKVMTASRAIRTQVGGSATFAEAAYNAFGHYIGHYRKFMAAAVPDSHVLLLVQPRPPFINI